MSLSVRPLAVPLSVSSGFGDRTHPVTGEESDHRGVDYRAPVGTPLFAMGDGVVSKVNETAAGGRQAFFDLGDGVAVSYSHMNTVDVRPGQRVRAGQVVGTVGKTGRVTGPHLHLQMAIDGVIIDPTDIVELLDAPPAQEGGGGLALLGLLGLLGLVALTR